MRKVLALFLICLLSCTLGLGQEKLDEAERRAEFERHLDDVFYPEDPTVKLERAWYRKRQQARRRILELMTSEELPIFFKRVRSHHWKKRPSARWQMIGLNAYESMEILRDYYIKTQDKKVEQFFIDLLTDGEHSQVRRLFAFSEQIHTDPKTKRGGMVPVKGILESSLVERIHKEYRGFEKLESSLAAAAFLIGADAYRAEMLWFVCTVLKDPERRVTQAYTEHYRQRSDRPNLTRRDVAQVLAFGTLANDVERRADYDAMRTYRIPWEKTLFKNKRIAMMTGGCMINPLVYILRFEINPATIPAGQPVPPKPKTVVPLSKDGKAKPDKSAE